MEIKVKVLESESDFLPPNDFIISLYSSLLLPDFFLKVEIKVKVLESESGFLPPNDSVIPFLAHCPLFFLEETQKTSSVLCFSLAATKKHGNSPFCMKMEISSRFTGICCN